jgi:hypothetical protein
MFPVTFEGLHTTFVIDQPCNGVVLMTIAGSDPTLTGTGAPEAPGLNDFG